MSPLQAHLHMLETWPKERITKHERSRERLEDRRGYATPITPSLVARYISLKERGTRYDAMRKELNASSTTMRKLKEAAWATRAGSM